MKIYKWIGTMLLLTLVTCSSKDSPKHVIYQTAPLDAALKAFQKDPIMRHGTVSFCLRKASNGQVVHQFNAQKSLAMASNMKLITTASALNILGPDYTFMTYLQYDGKIVDGVLRGNIYIKGTGDPTLGSYRMKATPNLDVLVSSWASKVKALGIRKIEGKIIADNLYYELNTVPSGWIWGDLGNYYGASAMALNCADNTYTLYIRPGAVGAPTKVIKTSPAIPSLRFDNQIKTARAGTGDHAYIDGAPYSNIRFLHGTIPTGGTFKIKGSIPDPALLLSERLFRKLAAVGLKAKSYSTTGRLTLAKVPFSQTRKTFHTHKSPKLSTIVSWVNLFSVNLYAEALYKAVGHALASGQSKETPADVIKSFWKLKGMSWDGLDMLDGSGLSPSNGTPTFEMSKMLYLMSKQSTFSPFYKSLPIAGTSGTMTNMGKGTIIQGNLRAKTGWITGCVAFSGYFKTKSGELMTFSICANRFDANYATMKKKILPIMVKMASL